MTDRPSGPETVCRAHLYLAGSVRVAVVTCSGRQPVADEEIDGFGLVLPQCGLLEREVDGAWSLLNGSMAYLERPGDVQRISHPMGGDVCTAIEVDSSWLGSLADPDRPLARSIRLPPWLHLEHRHLLVRAKAGEGEELEEAIMMLAVGVLEAMANEAVHQPPPAAAKRVARKVASHLSENPSLALMDLARIIDLPAYQVSRLFHAGTGTTVSRYRRRLRLERALDLIAEGEEHLALVAADAGFADQAHLTRSLREEYGTTPAALKRRWRPRQY